MFDLFGVVIDNSGGRSLVSWHNTLDAAKADAAKRSASDTSGQSRFFVLGPLGFYGKPVIAPEWHAAPNGNGGKK